jgi:hypothetical protein
MGEIVDDTNTYSQPSQHRRLQSLSVLRVAFELPDEESSQDTNEGESSALSHGLFV